MTTKLRCAWAESDPLLRDYHDKEWGRPVHDSREMWETLMLEGFQAGLSWLIVLRKREGFRKAFHGFDPVKVARMTASDVERLMQDPEIIRARAKIEATITGAQIFLAMKREGEDFAKLIWGMAGGKPMVNTTGAVYTRTALSEEISKALKKKGFKFVGPVIVYAWLQAVGIVEDHSSQCFRKSIKKKL
ncbi:MAG: DNA-3-methyladenine glycosylase I [Edaphobacter sp.]|uniref:DNA-3-methyladenine glycosylase I n=1 Tax=Edaphobacter sp. TaxID=1934404 RepID=UPI00239BB9AC|nr:DNA-3-methyladenine glycosylase I [Edaphobacter sp.]MDE1177265.1 DNA-3-methyladenine glycosylase I [Edaphobacter sp.]